MTKQSELLTVGRVAGVFGIKGWVKVKSYTQPETAIVDYLPWQVKTAHGVKTLSVSEHQQTNKGLIVRFEGVDDRTAAELYVRSDIAVRKHLLPPLQEDDFYWHQLIGLQVIHAGEEGEVVLGEVQKLMETGANDVLVLRPCEGSIDDRERLVPYVYGSYVQRVDLQKQVIHVDWDPEF